jgi:hypothetical protein
MVNRIDAEERADTARQWYDRNPSFTASLEREGGAIIGRCRGPEKRGSSTTANAEEPLLPCRTLSFLGSPSTVSRPREEFLDLGAGQWAAYKSP